MAFQLATLLRDPVFSDLVLQCEGENFHVHRCIVCPQSPVLAAACGGSFQEAKDQAVKVTVESPEAVRRLVAYFYTGDYDDREPRTAEEKAGDPPPKSESKTDPSLEDGQDAASSAKMNGAIETCGVPTAETDNNGLLMANSHVYVLAEYYQIPKLKDIAVQKFCSALENPKLPGFVEVVTFVHTSEYLSMAQELQSEISSVVTKNAKTMVKDKAFMEECSRLPTLMKALLPQLVAAYEEQQDVAIANISGLESDFRELNSELEKTKKQHDATLDRTKKQHDATLEQKKKHHDSTLALAKRQHDVTLEQTKKQHEETLAQAKKKHNPIDQNCWQRAAELARANSSCLKCKGKFDPMGYRIGYIAQYCPSCGVSLSSARTSQSVW